MKAYLLAAGRGKRAGGPKALKMTNGRTWLEQQIEFLLTLFTPENIAVSIQKEWLNTARAINRAVTWVPVNPDDSPLASLQLLMGHSPIKDWASLHHVDMPVFDKSLFTAPTNSKAEAIIPSFKGKKGHPVLLSLNLQKPILALNSETDRLDHFLRTRKTEIVEAGSDAILANHNS